MQQQGTGTVQQIQLSQFERENKRLIAFLAFIFSIGVGALTWYMGTLNNSIAKLNSTLNDMRTDYKELSIRFNIAEANQLRFDAESKNSNLRLNNLEKNQEMIKMRQENHGETLKRHDLLINDKRRKVNEL